MSKEKIKINGKLFEINSIIQVNPHVIKIDFSNDIPNNLGDITIYTAGGVESGQITGYNTVYRDDGKTIYLSDDGSVYTPPDPKS